MGSNSLDNDNENEKEKFLIFFFDERKEKIS